MSDWTFLNKHRYTEASNESDIYCLPENQTTDADGFKGFFRFEIDEEIVRCLATSDKGWQHVTVHIVGQDEPPTWKFLCQVKDLFWEPDDWVLQIHPPKNSKVHYQKGYAHLWRSISEIQPLPDELTSPSPMEKE